MRDPPCRRGARSAAFALSLPDSCTKRAQRACAVALERDRASRSRHAARERSQRSPRPPSCEVRPRSRPHSTRRSLACLCTSRAHSVYLFDILGTLDANIVLPKKAGVAGTTKHVDDPAAAAQRARLSPPAPATRRYSRARALSARRSPSTDFADRLARAAAMGAAAGRSHVHRQVWRADQSLRASLDRRTHELDLVGRGYARPQAEVFL